MTKRALITGLTGQDGAYLTKFLLDKGYEVFGTYRRLSTPNFWRLQYLGVFNKVKLVSVDITDTSSVFEAVKACEPDEIYHLASQSFVPTSFEQPVSTGDITGLGVARLLEAVRKINPHIKIYNAATSELYGHVDKEQQIEDTPFRPASPYAAAKLYGYWMTRMYRDAYGIFACNGILFNHESLVYETPVIIRRNQIIDILPIGEVVGNCKVTSKITERIQDLEIWDKDGFTEVEAITKYKASKIVVDVEARGGAIMLTRNHKICNNSNGILAQQAGKGTEIETVSLPKPLGITSVSREIAWLMGILVADGSASKGHLRFTNKSQELVGIVAEVWQKVTGGTSRQWFGLSGWNKNNKVIQLDLVGASWFTKMVNDECYTKSRKKRIPQIILNADVQIWKAFLEGYNSGDGLQAGHCKYEFKNFKTNSAVLALGLWVLVQGTTGQRVILNVDRKPSERGKYYSLNINASQEFNKNQYGQHLIKPLGEVKRNRRIEAKEWWFYDLATTSGTYHAGVGQILLYNSPLRGLEFVTRKITNAVAKISLGLEQELRLGNLYASRDWGHSSDYCEAMYLILQQENPDDYVIATNETHTIEEFVEKAFNVVGLDWQKYVRIDEQFIRPSDVSMLKGDYSKAKKVLGWKPKIRFNQLVEMMVKEDVSRWLRWQKGESFPWDAANYSSESNILSRRVK